MRDGHQVTTDTEHDRRRAAILHLHPDERRRPQYVAAWVLGPLGLLVTIPGIVLALTSHPGFWGLAGGGAVLLSVALSCYVVSRPTRTN